MSICCGTAPRPPGRQAPSTRRCRRSPRWSGARRRQTGSLHPSGARSCHPHHHRRKRSSRCMCPLHASPSRPDIPQASRRREQKRYLAERIRKHQWWHAHVEPGVFVCGRCVKAFDWHHGARSHREICEGHFQRELERFTKAITDKRSPAQKRREMRISLGLPVYGHQGRPQHVRNVFKPCLEDLSSAEKKRDHLRR